MKKVLNFLKSILLGKYCALIFAIIAAIDVIINYSYRVVTFLLTVRYSTDFQ